MITSRPPLKSIVTRTSPAPLTLGVAEREGRKMDPVVGGSVTEERIDHQTDCPGRYPLNNCFRERQELVLYATQILSSIR